MVSNIAEKGNCGSTISKNQIEEKVGWMEWEESERRSERGSEGGVKGTNGIWEDVGAGPYLAAPLR